MNRTTLAVILVAALALSGCLNSPADAGEKTPTFRFHGLFSENATAENLIEFSSRVEARGGTSAVLESFPMQFIARGFTGDACRDAWRDVIALPFVVSAGACFEEEPASGNPDEPTSSAS